MGVGFDLKRPDADADREIMTVKHEHICMRVCVRFVNMQMTFMRVLYVNVMGYLMACLYVLPSGLKCITCLWA